MSLAIVIPVYNEEKNIIKLLNDWKNIIKKNYKKKYEFDVLYLKKNEHSRTSSKRSFKRIWSSSI